MNKQFDEKDIEIARLRGQVAAQASQLGSQALSKPKLKNPCATWGFWLSFFSVWVVGIILSVIGLVKAKERNGVGMSNAIFGIVFGLFWGWLALSFMGII